MTLRTDVPVRAAEHGADWLELPDAPAAAGLARRFVSGCLDAAEPHLADLVDVAILLTSELVANALLHGLAPIRLQLRRWPGTVRIEVHDHGSPFTAPAASAWSLTDESGRGLPLLDALATSWGSHTNRDTASGKTLWFELGFDPPAPTPGDPGRTHRAT